FVFEQLVKDGTFRIRTGNVVARTAEGVEEQQVRIDLGPLGDTPDKGRAATEAPAAVEFEVGLDTVLPPLGEELGVLTAGRPQELADALGNVRIRTLDRVEGH